MGIAELNIIVDKNLRGLTASRPLPIHVSHDRGYRCREVHLQDGDYNTVIYAGMRHIIQSVNVTVRGHDGIHHKKRIPANETETFLVPGARITVTHR